MDPKFSLYILRMQINRFCLNFISYFRILSHFSPLSKSRPVSIFWFSGVQELWRSYTSCCMQFLLQPLFYFLFFSWNRWNDQVLPSVIQNLPWHFYVLSWETDDSTPPNIILAGFHNRRTQSFANYIRVFLLICNTSKIHVMKGIFWDYLVVFWTSPNNVRASTVFRYNFMNFQHIWWVKTLTYPYVGEIRIMYRGSILCHEITLYVSTILDQVCSALLNLDSLYCFCYI